MAEFQKKLPKCSEEEYAMADALFTRTEDPYSGIGKYTSEYREALLKVIEAKRHGVPIEAPGTDLTAAIAAPVTATRQEAR